MYSICIEVLQCAAERVRVREKTKYQTDCGHVGRGKPEVLIHGRNEIVFAVYAYARAFVYVNP